MARRGVLLSAVFIAVIAVGILAWWLLSGSRTEPAVSTPSPEASPKMTPTGTSSPVPLEVSASISGLPGNPAQYVSTQSPIHADYSQAFPKGTMTHALDNTWSESGNSQGLVQVEISKPGKPDETYAAMMVLEDGTWKVLATIPVTK